MKVSKAIELLSKTFCFPDYDDSLDINNAIKLGIEALRAVIDARANNYYTPIQPLPGETPEEGMTK